ncbi:hypothetical protein PR202_gb02506 [Eleusine coracana subsp. coracana]|uniref:Uncharacterized protein n=1 Tax=Eleusine coracana subsp. coracana TaxID=191504 RepID=A0AAV5DZG4_ELECO|nr:hypothetical protein PR202_gb02506 [Eleusine coracana subsp. coracana]
MQAYNNSYPIVSPTTMPACRSASSLTGSRKVMLTRNPRPVKSQSFYHEKGRAVSEAADRRAASLLSSRSGPS